MDILGVVNDYINNKNSKEQLPSVLINLLNSGESIEKIAIDHNYEPEDILVIIQKSGYAYDPISQNWVLNGTQNLDLLNVAGSIKENAENSKDDNSEVNKLPLLSNTNTYEEQDIVNDIKTITDQINSGTPYEEICNKYNVTSPELHNILLSNGYQHYLFMNFWTRMNRKELCAHLVIELNKGYSLYELSERYVNSNHARITFVNKLQQLLNLYGYKYSLLSKTWTVKESNKNIQEENKLIETVEKVEIEHLDSMVNDINLGIPMKSVAENNKIPLSNLRQVIKNQYHYDGLFKIWTKEDRKTLLHNLSNELSLGNITLDELKKKDINIPLLEIELERYRYNLYNKKHNNKIKESNNLNNNPETKNVLSESTTSIEITNKQTVIQIEPKNPSTSQGNECNNVVTSNIFSDQDISCIREIIDFWQQKKIEESRISNIKEPITIFLDDNTIRKLTFLSEKKGLSRSLIIDKALTLYFNTEYKE